MYTCTYDFKEYFNLSSWRQLLAHSQAQVILQAAWVTSYDDQESLWVFSNLRPLLVEFLPSPLLGKYLSYPHMTVMCLH